MPFSVARDVAEMASEVGFHWLAIADGVIAIFACQAMEHRRDRRRKRRTLEDAHFEARLDGTYDGPPWGEV